MAMLGDTVVPLIKNLLLLDSEGKRIAVKYYGDTWQNVAQEQAFEKSLFGKTQRANARGEPEVIMFDSVVVVYKSIGDVHFYVTGDQNENEIILVCVLSAFYEAVTMLLRNNVDKRTVLENLDLVFMTIDELVDGGIILETDPSIVASRVSMRGADELPLSEQTLSQAFALAKEQLARSLLK